MYTSQSEERHNWKPSHKNDKPTGAYKEQELQVSIGVLWEWDKAISDLIRYREKGEWWRNWQRVMLVSKSMRSSIGLDICSGKYRVY